MKTSLTLIALFIFNLAIAGEGQDLFRSSCAACHTIGKGRLVGPDLVNVTEKKSQDWLVAFIKSSQTMIKAGDSDAVAIAGQYKGLVMPDQPFSNEQILSILDYIKGGGEGSENSTAVPVDILSEATVENIDRGAALFSGKNRFTNGGAACSACHSVKDERIFSAGTFAKNLTESWDNMGSSGIAAIIGSPPFPVMNMAYAKYPLTPEEVIDLTAYLKSVSKERYYQRASDFSLAFAFLGFILFTIIVTGTILLYIRRKSYPVNDDILNRPSKVVN